MCAAHVINLSSNFVEIVDFSNLRDVTVGWFLSFSE